MRFYGVRSGRNNMARYLARSYMWNSKNNKNISKNTYNHNNSYDYSESVIALFGILTFIVIIISLYILLLAR